MFFSVYYFMRYEVNLLHHAGDVSFDQGAEGQVCPLIS